MEFEALKQSLIDAANAAGVKDWEIYYMESAETSAQTYQKGLQGVASSRAGGICFRCIVDGRMGYASTELLTPEEMAALVARAVTVAKYIESDDQAVIFSGSPAYASPKAAAKLPEMSDITAAALALAEAGYAADDRVADGTQAQALAEEVTIHLVNSTGLALSNHVTLSAAVLEAIVGDETEKQVSFDIARSIDQASLNTLAADTVVTALSMLGATETATGRRNVVFAPKQMRNILSTFSPVFSAKNAQQGLSLLAGKEGEMIAAPIVTLTDDPAHPDALAHAPFDAEGVATSRKAVIRAGKLETLLHNLATAAKAGVTTTANASKGSYASPVGISPYCLCLEAGELSFDELLKLADSGVYVTEMKGFHAGADAVTGDFSIECAGFAIEDGRLGGPIKSFTVAGNFFALLRDIKAMSDKVEVGFSGGFTCFGAPAVLVPDMSVAGK